MNIYKNQRVKVANFELKSNVLQSLIQNRKLKSSLRWFFSITQSQKRKQASKVRVRNRCVLSHRPRSIYRFARLSRLFLRDNQFIGALPGLRKSYW